ncbi:hypothetical protein MRB53_041360 [Persea americana]|nr:hypothetical protein MRB53_041360 [Persea americana]
MKLKEGLPLPAAYHDREDDYVRDLLSFTTNNTLVQDLCGGVHLLDAFTRSPDIYETLLPQTWRSWFDLQELQDVLDLVLEPTRADLEGRTAPSPPDSAPHDLLQYLQTIRNLSLDRRYFPRPRQSGQIKITRKIAAGMKEKKLYEVQQFAGYVHDLADTVNHDTVLVDFGSGQNYLGRTLASAPYCRDVIAVESRAQNIERSKAMDIHAGLVAKREVIRRNKKLYRAQLDGTECEKSIVDSLEQAVMPVDEKSPAIQDVTPHDDNMGSVRYVQARLSDGRLETVLDSAQACSAGPSHMVISLHSCGNLSHHGLRSLVLNRSVAAVALIGCCYNLVTEKQGPTYKLEELRPHDTKAPALKGDPQGFPMSKRLSEYPTSQGPGVRMNISCRMLAVQSPANWSKTDRHFFRALLQKIFMDYGVVAPPSNPDEDGFTSYEVKDGSQRTAKGSTAPIIIGNLKTSCYTSFVAYVRGALTKLRSDPTRASMLDTRLASLSDDDINEYEAVFTPRKKQLSIVWTLMAYSAAVYESLIIVDRLLWLREQPEVEQAWVEAVFDYARSPRNMAIIGMKRRLS